MLDNSIPESNEVVLSDSWSDEDIEDLSAFVLSNTDDGHKETDR